jgi:hypothetical protein
MDKAQAKLKDARGDVDRVGGLPQQQRTANQVTGAVQGMFDVIPVLMEAVTLLSNRAERVYPQLSDALVSARLAAELREQAGRLGSKFTAAIATQRPARVRRETGHQQAARANRAAAVAD